jgi:hypothetical protein
MQGRMLGNRIIARGGKQGQGAEKKQRTFQEVSRDELDSERTLTNTTATNDHLQ